MIKFENEEACEIIRYNWVEYVRNNRILKLILKHVLTCALAWICWMRNWVIKCMLEYIIKCILTYVIKNKRTCECGYS